MQATTAYQRVHFFAQFIFWGVAGFYAYGALVHVLNMLSLTGFNWVEAPVKWQVLDVTYLVLDLVVVTGLIWALWVGVVAFFCAALSQIVLYTVFRNWILDVPPEFQRGAQDLAYLDNLVVFHIVSSIAMGAAIMLRRHS